MKTKPQWRVTRHLQRLAITKTNKWSHNQGSLYICKISYYQNKQINKTAGAGEDLGAAGKEIIFIYRHDGKPSGGSFRSTNKSTKWFRNPTGGYIFKVHDSYHENTPLNHFLDNSTHASQEVDSTDMTNIRWQIRNRCVCICWLLTSHKYEGG